MRILVSVLLVLCLGVGQGWAKVSVSPVIIEATEVKKGDVFQVWCAQEGSEPLNVQLSLALFDQDGDGNVFFLEDPESVHLAHRVLRLEQEQFSIGPQEQHGVEIEVLEDDFTSFYAVLFVKPDQPGIPTRFAVLFLLSSSGLREEVTVSTWEQKAESLELTIVNSGTRHGLWRGELLLYGSSGNLNEKREVQSGVVLAGRSREWGISLPAWVQHVELTTPRQGADR